MNGSNPQPASTYWPLQMWADAVSNGADALARNRFAAAQLDLFRKRHDVILDEAKELFDRRCSRQLDTVQGAVALADELRKAGPGPEAFSAWVKWYSAAMDKFADEVKDQVRFASTTAKCCLDVMAAGVPPADGHQTENGYGKAA